MGTLFKAGLDSSRGGKAWSLKEGGRVGGVAMHKVCVIGHLGNGNTVQSKAGSLKTARLGHFKGLWSL